MIVNLSAMKSFGFNFIAETQQEEIAQRLKALHAKKGGSAATGGGESGGNGDDPPSYIS